MAVPKRLQQLQAEFHSIQQNLTVSKGAVYIKDPSKCRKCPICQQNIYLYHLNFEEMFLMCENSFCDFPFGYEAIQIVRNESELEQNPVKATKEFFEYPPKTVKCEPLSHSVESILGATTMSSVSLISDSDMISQMADTEELPKEETISITKENTMEKKEKQQNIEVQNNLKRLKVLMEEMNVLIDADHKEKRGSKEIKNQKWLQTLKEFEDKSGKKFLTDKEQTEFVKNDCASTDNEMTVSVDLNNQAGENLTFEIKILSPERNEKVPENFEKGDNKHLIIN